jgi:hypothetical protein
MTDIETRLRRELTREAERVQPESLRSLRPPLAGPSSADQSSAQAVSNHSGSNHSGSNHSGSNHSGSNGSGLAAAWYGRFRLAGGHRVARLRLGLASAGTIAVVIVAALAGLAVAGRSAEGGASIRDELGAAAAPLPRFYVALAGQQPGERAVVHDSVSGQALSSAPVPAVIQDAARSQLHIAADAENRTFALVAESGVGHRHPALRVLLLRVSADGRTPGLRLLPGRFAVADPAARVTGVALSADGTSLAAALATTTLAATSLATSLAATAPRRAGHASAGHAFAGHASAGHAFAGHAFVEHAFVETVSLRTGAVRIWAAVNEVAADPSWVTGGYVGFVAQPRQPRQPSAASGIPPARTQVRLLDTAGAGRSLLTSRVLATSGKSLGSISSALMSPDGQAILATTYRNVAGRRRRGHAVDQLVSLSAATGRVTGRLQTVVVGYRGAQQRSAADFSCQVLSLAGGAGPGQALVQCPRLARLSGGRLTELPPVAAQSAVSW